MSIIEAIDSLEGILMKLYLVQHGEAVTKEIDPDRPLSEQGRQDVERTAGFLKKTNVRVEQVFHSGKSRALQTAEILAAALYSAGSVEVLDNIKPKDEVMPFANLVSSWQQDSLVVGHLPFMVKAVCMLLTGNEEQAAIDFKPGSLVCLERKENGAWGLAWMIRPELFRE